MSESKLRVLRTVGLSKDYGRGEGLVRAVDEFDFDVAPGETVAVTGPSGCGKSTLLHLLGGQDRPTRGEIWLAGQRLDKLSERRLTRVRRDSWMVLALVIGTVVVTAGLTALPARRSARTALVWASSP